MLSSPVSSRLLLVLSCTFSDSVAVATSVHLPGRAIRPFAPAVLASAWRTSMHGSLSPDSVHLASRSSIGSEHSCWSTSMRSISRMSQKSVTATLHTGPSRLPALRAHIGVAGTNRAALAAHRPLLHTSLRLPHLSQCRTMARERALHAASTRRAGDEAHLQAPKAKASPVAGSACSQSPPLLSSSQSSPSTTPPCSTDPATAATSPPAAACEPAPASPLHDPPPTAAEAPGPAPSATPHTSHTSASPAAPEPTAVPSAPAPSMDPPGSIGQYTGSTGAAHTGSPSTPAFHLGAAGQCAGITSAGPTGSPATSTSPSQAAPTRVVVVGVDPDTNGALAVASWLSYDLSEKVDLSRAQWQMYDVPVAVVELLTKTKDGKSRRRRWLDIIAARKIILQIVQRFNGDSPAYARAVNQTSYATHSSAWAPQDSLLTQRRYYDPRPPQQEQQHSLQEQKEHVAGSSGSSSSTGTSGQAQEAVHGSGLPPSSLAGGQAASTGLEAGGTGSKADVTAPANVPVDMRAFVEAPPIMPHSCSPRTMAQQLYAVGVWYGLLSMAGFQTATVNVMHWKGDLGLKGLDKDDSRLLARQLIPSKTSVLERKKDHGRAEALLIAAWAMGCTRPNPMSSKRARKAAAASVAAAKAGASPSNPGPSMASSFGSSDAPSLLAGTAAASSSSSSSGGDANVSLLQPIPSYPAYAIDSNGAVVSLSKGYKPLKVSNGCVSVKNEHGARVRVRVEELISRSRSAGGHGPSSPSIPALGVDTGNDPSNHSSSTLGFNSGSDPSSPSIPALGWDTGSGPSNHSSPALALSGGNDQGPATPAKATICSGSEIVESSPSHLYSTVHHDSASQRGSLNHRDGSNRQNSPSHHDCHQPSSTELFSSTDSSSSSSSSSGRTRHRTRRLRERQQHQMLL
uniref:Uncharacterized protein n=1 Tax=Dunaliella tertiolecta TaxID=3047 RepID=A0A7S3QXA2_DUNTE